MMIEIEKLRLISLSCREGIKEKEVERILNEENIPDYDFANLKIRLGIKVVKKTYGQKVEERKQLERDKEVEHEK